MNYKTTLALATTLIVTAGAQERFDLKVRNFFFAGFAGSQESLDKGMKMSEEELQVHPKNAEALVWHGAGLYYQSGQAFRANDQQKGVELFQRSQDEMDQAVALKPDSIGVRIPRGASLMAGSRFTPDPAIATPLLAKAISDYEKAYELQASQLDTLGTHTKGELLIGLAEGYARMGNQEKAAAFYAQLEKELPGTAYAKKGALYRETKAPQAGCLGCHTAK